MNFFGFKISNKFRSKTPKGFYDAIKGHTGLDFIMPEGTPIRSPVDGEVAARVKQPEMGNVLYVRDTEGLIHVFAHTSQYIVQTGDKVSKNQIVALSGNTGTASTNPHVHWEIIAPKPEPGLEMMSRTLGGFMGWNIDPEKFLKGISPDEFMEASDWAIKHGIITKAHPEDSYVTWKEFMIVIYRIAKKILEWSKS